MGREAGRRGGGGRVEVMGRGEGGGEEGGRGKAPKCMSVKQL